MTPAQYKARYRAKRARREARRKTEPLTMEFFEGLLLKPDDLKPISEPDQH